jgi:hypothetical protein
LRPFVVVFIESGNISFFVIIIIVITLVKGQGNQNNRWLVHVNFKKEDRGWEVFAWWLVWQLTGTFNVRKSQAIFVVERVLEAIWDLQGIGFQVFDSGRQFAMRGNFSVAKTLFWLRRQ